MKCTIPPNWSRRLHVRVHLSKLLFAILHAPVLGLAAVLFQNILGSDRQFFMIGGATAIGFLFQSLGAHLKHSHIWFSFGPWLNRVVISPAHHQIHHSVDPRHWNKNFGASLRSGLALRGAYSPYRPEKFRIGLPNEEPREFTTVLKLYFLPFVNVVRRFLTWPVRKGDAYGFESRAKPFEPVDELLTPVREL